jgi:hypothetical protein
MWRSCTDGRRRPRQCASSRARCARKSRGYLRIIHSKNLVLSELEGSCYFSMSFFRIDRHPFLLQKQYVGVCPHALTVAETHSMRSKAPLVGCGGSDVSLPVTTLRRRRRRRRQSSCTRRTMATFGTRRNLSVLARGILCWLVWTTDFWGVWFVIFHSTSSCSILSILLTNKLTAAGASAAMTPMSTRDDEKDDIVAATSSTAAGAKGAQSQPPSILLSDATKTTPPMPTVRIPHAPRDQRALTMHQVLFRAGQRGLGGGIPGAIAGAIQVLSLMWLRTIINYQCRYGTTFRQALRTLLNEGGIGRLYCGMGFALIQAPLSRFVSTAANDGVESLLANLSWTQSWGAGRTTVVASIVVGLWRMLLMRTLLAQCVAPLFLSVVREPPRTLFADHCLYLHNNNDSNLCSCRYGQDGAAD